MTKTKKQSACPCLEVTIGKQKAIIAGLENGAVGVSLYWGPPPSSSDRKSKTKRPSGELIVNGVSNGEQKELVQWLQQKLKPGDEVIVRCLARKNPDSPESQHLYDAETGTLHKVRKKTKSK